MQQQTMEKLKSMDDFQILRFFNHFNNSLIERSNADADDIIKGLPDDIKGIDEMKTILQSRDEYDTALPPNEATSFARLALEEMAANADTEPILAESLANYKDNEMVAGVILALGSVVGFILLISSHKVTYSREKGWQLKDATDTEIKAKTEMIKTLLSSIPDAVTKLGKLR